MSITRINEFRAHEGGGDLLRDRLKAVVPAIEASDGCRSCQLLQSRKNPAHILMIEVWDSIDAHHASLQKAPHQAYKDAMPLFAVPPTGEYYDLHPA